MTAGVVGNFCRSAAKVEIDLQDLYDLTKSLQQNKIDSDKFISKTFEILKEYSIHTKNNPNYEPMWIYYEMYFNFYRLHNRYDLVLEMLYTYNTPFDFSVLKENSALHSPAIEFLKMYREKVPVIEKDRIFSGDIEISANITLGNCPL